MRLCPAVFFPLLSRALLRGASLLVPKRQRAEWWREWRAEVWHVRHACTEEGSVWDGEREVISFCVGAFQDALCLRSHFKQERVPLATTNGSARQCLFLLTGVASLGLGVAMLLPAVRAQLQLAPYREAQDLVLIGDARYKAGSLPTITAEQFGGWTKRRQTIFESFAFYRLGQANLPNELHGRTALEIAYATSNLFEVLGVPLRFAVAGDQNRGLPKLVLSDEAWKKDFGGNEQIFGRVVRLGTRNVVITGVAPKDSWRLPGTMDAWLLLPVAEFEPAHVGFVLARVSLATAQRGWGDRWTISGPGPDGSSVDLLCVSLAERMHRTWNVFLLGVFLACLSLPATTSLPLGEYRVMARNLSWWTSLRRWTFLMGKIALLLPIVCLVSLDLRHLVSLLDPVWGENVHLASSFSICLFGLRWILRDQRQRCPMCLGKLTHPARVGQPSRNFLAWNGTELMCVGGHGLLHIPEIATSWFSTQRWLSLDASWEGLFVESRVGLALRG